MQCLLYRRMWKYLEVETPGEGMKGRRSGMGRDTGMELVSLYFFCIWGDLVW